MGKKKQKLFSWKSLDPQESKSSGSSHSEAAGVIRQVAGLGYYKTGHSPWRADFLVFHGDRGSPTEAEITMNADLKEKIKHTKRTKEVSLVLAALFSAFPQCIKSCHTDGLRTGHSEQFF